MIDFEGDGVAIRTAIQIDAWRRAQPVRGADEGIKPGVSEGEPQGKIHRRRKSPRIGRRRSNISLVKFNPVDLEELDELVAGRDGLMMLLLP